ncbi:MAG: hypothetical protein HOU81_27410 [Hamadaea sp.]|uniref:hypothetical protein n=1 Tax=Hamadaea sp. TaxID=2024425 RepID=UPI00182957E6|nr:hypothetical protein [Hamadaea sp.]NUR74555.1 hypothetical protein [Hamadaea sp.]NUT20797.1 hypothetical protein [Hamadaea sp.]
MRRTLTTGSIAIATAAAVILTGSLSASATTAPTAAPTATSVYLAANGKLASSAAVEPQTAPISRDSSLKLTSMAWSSWADNATGTGVATINLCDPSCANGTSTQIPVTVTLSAPQQLCGRDFYTEMQLAFDGTLPGGLPSRTSVPVAPVC